MISALFQSSQAATGNQRFQDDKRRVAGALLVLSLTVAYFPLARLAPLINRDGATVDSGVQLALLVGNLCAFAMGILGMTVGGLSLIHDFSSSRLTASLLLIEQTALIPYVADIYNIYKMADTGAAFIPGVYNPTAKDVWFVGAMGIAGAATFCFFLFGGLALLAFAHFSYQTGTPRNGTYYRRRLVFYSIVMLIAGAAQLSLGSYIVAKFGSGPLPAPIGVAMFMIHFPEIAIAVGGTYILNGCFGVYRGLAGPFHRDNHSFSATMWVQYVATLVLMVLVQTSYAPGATMAQATPTIANLTFGTHLVPVFLDYMGRAIPNDTRMAEYYKINSVPQNTSDIEANDLQEQSQSVRA